MLVLLLLLSLPLGWLSARLQKARRQRDAIKNIQALGAICRYDWEPSPDWQRIPLPPSGPAPAPAEPKWIIDLLGGDFFWNVTVIDWSPVGSSPSATRKNLALLKEFPELEGVWLGEVTDEWVAYLGSVGTLRRLTIPKADIVDDDLMYLSHLTNLEELVLTDCSRVTSDGLAHLSGLTKMTILSLSGTSVEDAGMRHIGRMSGLKWLMLTNTKISDEGLAYLRDCVQLEILSIAFTNVTDAGLAHIARMKNLAELDLVGTEITDLGLEHLFGLKLDRLGLGSRRITPDGVKRIQDAMPRCRVYYVHDAAAGQVEPSTAVDPFGDGNGEE
ncbi:MAG: leucine-rich repeat domain-containing protein [Thermoguttaceae bacterium]